MSDLFSKAKVVADDHEQAVDKGLDKAAEQLDSRTGGKFDKQVDAGVEAAKKHIGDGDPNN